MWNEQHRRHGDLRLRPPTARARTHDENALPQTGEKLLQVAGHTTVPVRNGGLLKGHESPISRKRARRRWRRFSAEDRPPAITPLVRLRPPIPTVRPSGRISTALPTRSPAKTLGYSIWCLIDLKFVNWVPRVGARLCERSPQKLEFITLLTPQGTAGQARQWHQIFERRRGTRKITAGRCCGF